MTEWREAALQDIAYVNPAESISNGTKAKKVPMELLEPFTKRVSGYQIEEYKGGVKFKNGDTIIARITPSLENGKTAFIDILEDDEIGFGSTEFIVLREKEGLSDKNFLYYLALSPDFRETAILSMTGSSGRQRVQTDVVKEHLFNIPPLPEQRAIGSVLSSLDDKIDLLYRQNKTLEQMAEALFRQWFVVGASEDWEVGKLGDVIELFDSMRIPLSKMQRDKMKDGKLYPYYGAASIMDYVNNYLFDGDYILIGEDGTVRTDEGYPILQYATGKFWVNNHAHILKAKPPYNNFFIWNYLSKKKIDEIVTGAVQHKINQGNLKSLDFPKYPIKLIEQFNNQTNNMFDKINKNKTQIRTLEKLRDTLLPKLMNGEIRIEAHGRASQKKGRDDR